jgi:hypothetical protein
MLVQDAAGLSLTTGRCDHAVPGDAMEWCGLDRKTASGQVLRIALPQSHVFEDVTTRLTNPDGNGRIGIACGHRSHPARKLVIVRLEGAEPVEPARLTGLTNHRISGSVLQGGLRDCGQGPELHLANPGWTRAMRILLRNGRLMVQPLGKIAGPQGLDAALACR